MEKIFAIWKPLSGLASDLGLPYQTVAAWVRRGSIPARYDTRLIEAAKARGATLTLEQLAAARAEPKVRDAA